LPQPRHATFDEAWSEARSLLDHGDLAGAHLLLSAWYGNPTLRPEEQQALTGLLSGLAGTVIYSPTYHLEQPYVVQGETLEQIAAKYNVPTELLAKINGLADTRQLQPGQQLKVVRGPFSAMVNLSQREMTLVLAGRYAGRFDIGVGQERQNIEGRYEVNRKLTNPPYYGPDRDIAPGSSENPLGTHFLSLVKPLDNAIAGPFGIHGTNDPASIHRDDPRGYIRLAPEHVADAYDILSERSEVIIRR
jgi:LysM repeat protein